MSSSFLFLIISLSFLFGQAYKVLLLLHRIPLWNPTAFALCAVAVSTTIGAKTTEMVKVKGLISVELSV